MRHLNSIPDEELDAFVAELKEDGTIISREEARDGLNRLTELYDLICRPLPDGVVLKDLPLLDE